MQPIQNVVEHLIQRNLARKTTVRRAQIGFDVLLELFFGQFGRDFAHNDTLVYAKLLELSSWARSLTVSSYLKFGVTFLLH